MVMRQGLLNFECDASVDRNTRKLLGLSGAGGAATVFRSNGVVEGISTDYPHIKRLDAVSVFGRTSVHNRPEWPMRVDVTKVREGKSKMGEKNEVKFTNSMAVEETVAYLEAIVAGIKKKAVNLKQGEQKVKLTPNGEVEVDVRAVHKKKKESILIELSWRVEAPNELLISNTE
jgi:amphi-Trp domain-containing protein